MSVLREPNLGPTSDIPRTLAVASGSGARTRMIGAPTSILTVVHTGSGRTLHTITSVRGPVRDLILYPDEIHIIMTSYKISVV